MVELKTIYLENNLIKHYAEDSQGNRYYIKQVETGVEYEEAIDVLPCKYTYIHTEKIIEKENVDV